MKDVSGSAINYVICTIIKIVRIRMYKCDSC